MKVCCSPPNPEVKEDSQLLRPPRILEALQVHASFVGVELRDWTRNVKDFHRWLGFLQETEERKPCYPQMTLQPQGICMNLDLSWLVFVHIDLWRDNLILEGFICSAGYKFKEMWSMSLGSALHLKSSPPPTPGTEQHGGKARRCLFPCCDGGRKTD